MFTKKILLCALVATMTSGCATIFDGRTQAVAFRSVPSEANIVITNRAGEKIHSATTPATVTLNRGSGYFKSEIYTVEVTKPGFQPKTITVKGSVNGWYFGNILVGGLIGMLIVDPITGAMYNLSPENIEATLNANKVSYEEGSRLLTVMLAEDVSPEILQQANRIN